MELTKNFDYSAAGQKWYKHWNDKKYFNSTPDDRDTYTVVIPPPNVTGVLHMGHCLNNTIQDILIRRARMTGKNACWVPGTDHASIATEAKVVQMLREKGIQKASLSREDFLKYAWEWKEKYGGIILEQLKKLGCSLDWNRTAFTMDDEYYKAVIKVFVDLYEKGLIYRGKRMVNWDPVGLTALSDEEVIFKEVNSKLFFVQYKFSGGNGGITVATTRPETILGDMAICVNPNDERYKNLVGKEVIVPIINRGIPIIADEYVTAEFGTGALKVTPAHDKNDNMLGAKHNLKAIDTLDASGKFTIAELTDDKPSELVMGYAGMDRFALRKKIAEDIAALGQLVKTEDYKSQVGTSERTGAVIENKLSMQWFVDMKKFMKKNPQILDDVMNDKIVFHPAKLKNTYRHWMENIKDWCISRQLWWGQRIPAWYDEQGNVHVAKSLEDLYNQKPETKNQKLIQDEDVLDTWFSSWLWPMEVFKGISNPGNADAKHYYPTTTLVTGQDIIFFWVARMIMAGFEYEGKKPFSDVYFTGMVRDKQGRKMSKQLGNSPDLLALIDQYGADAVRFGIMIASPAGNDLLFDESSLEQGRNFNNKLWNAMKLVKMWQEKQTVVSSQQAIEDNFAVQWFESRLNEVKAELDNQFKEFRLSEALKTIYSLIWDDFCSWYLEWVKPPMGENIDKAVYEKTVGFFEELMQLLHPFMPFITEDIYHWLRENRTDDITVKKYSETGNINYDILKNGAILKSDITAIREARIKNGIKNSEKLKFTAGYWLMKFLAGSNSILAILEKQTNIELNAGDLHEETALETLHSEINVRSVSNESYHLQVNKTIDTSLQKEELLKDLEYQKGFLASVEKKLGNERFMANARPEVIAIEQKKKADGEARIKEIERSLASL